MDASCLTPALCACADPIQDAAAACTCFKTGVHVAKHVAAMAADPHPAKWHVQHEADMVVD